MTKRLRIAVLSRNFSATGGGAERYAISLVEQLAETHEIHVFAQSIAHEFPGVTYHRVPMPMARPRWINQLYFAWKTWRMTRTGFDVVHSHENTWHGNVQTVHVLPVKHSLFVGKQGVGLALRWLKVITSPRLLVYLWLEAMRYRQQPGRHIVLTSNTLAQVMVETYPDGRSMFITIPPGVADAEGAPNSETKVHARQRLGLPLDVPLLLFVGNDMRKKGLPTLLKALEQLHGVHLAVVGQGKYMQAMQMQAQALSGRVHFLGALPEVADAYRAATLLVHPTLEDTYAMVVLEAMGHGLPVVVSGPHWCGIAAELRDEVEALILDNPEDETLMASAIARLLLDAARRTAFCAHGVAFASARTWQKVAQRHAELLGNSLSLETT